MTPKFEDMSREELLVVAKRQAEGLLYQGNHPGVTLCPFCLGRQWVSTLREAVKAHLVQEWRRDVTQAEEEAFVEKLNASYAAAASMEGPVQ